MNKTLRAFALVTSFVVIAGCGTEDPSPTSATLQAAVETKAEAPEPVRRYVGSESCRGCHADVYDDWRRSHHFQAMMPARAGTVQGDFDGATHEYYGVVSEFYQRDDAYFVRTDDAGGELREFEITHTFGVEPLQQYLVTFPDGRRQALGIAADTRENGGWFHVYPEQGIRAGDRLHWTAPDQNWNFMCADCHSTDLRKNYDARTRTYDTTWAELSVGCEACHGPGSEHVTWAAMGGGAGGAAAAGFRVRLDDVVVQTETCARCHSRRGILAESFEPGADFLDHYRLALLDEGLYHADGQILDEVYVHGSYLQSKMYRRGVRCSDCHRTHESGRDISANATCTHCHQSSPPDEWPTLASRDYDTPEHHFHATGSAGAQCVACHMPSRLYMVIDERHDHSLRIPRPDLSAELGVPNACNDCHSDQTAEWAAGQIAERYPAPRPTHHAAAFDAGRRGQPGADARLAGISADTTQSGIVRATALALLASYPTSGARSALSAGVSDPDALVRLGALRGMEGQPLERRWLLAGSALADPVLAVRMEAVTLLAPAPAGTANQRGALRAAVNEYFDVQRLNADRAETHANNGVVYAALGDAAAARAAYETALTLDPGWVPALVNLADLNREQGRDADSAGLFTRAVESEPANADVRQAHGMWLVRAGRVADAVAEFAAAVSLAPDDPRQAYVYGVALNSSGDSQAAIDQLSKAHQRFPADADILIALATMHRDRGETDSALIYADRLAALRPGDPGIRSLLEELRGGDGRP